MVKLETLDRYNQLRRNSCVCMKVRRIDLICCGEGNGCETFPLPTPLLATFICAITFGWIKIGCSRKIPNPDTHMTWLWHKIEKEDTCSLCCIGIFHTVCCLPIFAFSLISIIFATIMIEFPFFLFWCMTCACYGKMWPLKCVYTNQLNSYHENDEPPVVVEEMYTVREPMEGPVTYSENPFEETYWSRGRPCNCNLCLMCSCYQDLYWIDAHEEENDKSYQWYIPKYIKVQNSEHPDKSRLRIL